MNYFHPSVKIIKSKYFKIFNGSSFRCLSEYSHKSIIELNKYIYFDENRLQSEKLENDIRCRYPATDKINISRIREYIKIFRKHSAYKEDLTKAIEITRAEVKTLLGIMKQPNDDIKRRIALCNNRIQYFLQLLKPMVECHQELRALVFKEYLSIPNDLHEQTPKDCNEMVIYSKEISSSPRSNHLIVGKNLNVLNYFNSSFYFLLNQAALLEFAAINFFMKNLQNIKFMPFVNPDFCNNFILNSTSDRKLQHFFNLDVEEFSLVGGASFSSFCAYRIAQSVHMKFLPERFVTYGRQYVPQTKYRTEDGLYSVFQRSNVHLSIGTESEEQMNEEFERTLNHLKLLYETLEVDFKIVHQPASTLLQGESLRASIQLYSAHMKEYVEVAYLSLYGDFVSKRLLMLCHNKQSKHKFVNLIDGVAVSFPTLLAHLLERSGDKEIHTPECLRSYMYYKS